MDRQLFDLLKTPQQLNWLEAALIRDGFKEWQEFEEAYGVSVESAERILFAWEAAQSGEWNSELLCQFIDPEIFPNRLIVQLRIDAAMPEKFTPADGLKWLEKERIPIGDLDKWVLQNTSSPQAATPSAAPVVAESASDAPAWVVSKPKRYHGYASPLHHFLNAAHRAGKPRPSARDAVEEWRRETPAEIAQVLPDGINYYDSKGNIKAADLEAIRKAIDRMTSAR